jgi:hypothetical protein
MKKIEKRKLQMATRYLLSENISLFIGKKSSIVSGMDVPVLDLEEIGQCVRLERGVAARLLRKTRRKA